MGNVVRMLHDQVEEILKAATFADSPMAEDLCKRKRPEVEDNTGGLHNQEYTGVTLKDVLLTDAPHTTDPITAALESIKNKLDDVPDRNNNYRTSPISSLTRCQDRAIAGTTESSREKHKVYFGETLINEYRDNPELIGGACAELLPLGFTKEDIGKGGILPANMIKT